MLPQQVDGLVEAAGVRDRSEEAGRARESEGGD